MQSPAIKERDSDGYTNRCVSTDAKNIVKNNIALIRVTSKGSRIILFLESTFCWYLNRLFHTTFTSFYFVIAS